MAILKTDLTVNYTNNPAPIKVTDVNNIVTYHTNDWEDNIESDYTNIKLVCDVLNKHIYKNNEIGCYLLQKPRSILLTRKKEGIEFFITASTRFQMLGVFIDTIYFDNETLNVLTKSLSNDLNISYNLIHSNLFKFTISNTSNTWEFEFSLVSIVDLFELILIIKELL